MTVENQDPPVTEDDPKPPAPQPAQKSDDKPPRAEVPPEVSAALKQANKEAENLRKKLKEYEDRDKTEAEKLADKVAEAERRATDAESRLVRRDVALAKGLPAELVDRLQGTTREELEADADALLKLVNPSTPTGDGTKPPDLGQGRRQGTSTPSVASGREMFEARKGGSKKQ